MPSFTDLTQQLEQAQTALIAALDAQDADAIDAAVNSLAPLIEALQNSSALYAGADARARVEGLNKMADAAAYRINILHSQTRTRLEMLHDHSSKTTQTYSRPKAAAVSARAFEA